jgi:phospholipid/cholesterol/gamma-HCH transport system substrate-binding protein
MFSKHLVETIMGGVVLLVAGIFLGFAYVSADLSPSGGYSVTANFSSVDGLTIGSDVRIGGVKVGVVTGQTVDTKNYRAIIHMNLQSDVRLPEDSKAIVSTAGLLGGNYVKIEPGHGTSFIKPGGEITKTEGAVVLEELIGKIIFLATDQDTGSSTPGQPQAPGQPPQQTPPPTQNQAPAPTPDSGKTGVEPGK